MSGDTMGLISRQTLYGREQHGGHAGTLQHGFKSNRLFTDTRSVSESDTISRWRKHTVVGQSTTVI